MKKSSALLPFRVLCFLLAVLMLSAFAAGCTPSGGDTATSEQETETAAPPIEIDLSDPSAGYVIIRSDDLSAEALETVKSLKSKLQRSYSGGDFNLRSDFLNPAAGFRESDYEIVVGNCGREAAAALFSTLKYNDYVISVVGTKLLLVGGCEKATQNAVTYFTNHLVSADGKYTEGELYRYSAEYPVSAIKLNGTDISGYRIVYPANGKTKFADAAETLNSRLRALIGVSLETVSAQEPAAAHEIQLGDCGRAPSAGKVSPDVTEFLLGSDGNHISVVSEGGRPAVNSMLALIDQYFPENAQGTLEITIDNGESRMPQKLGTPLAPGASMRIMTNNVLSSDTLGERSALLVNIYMTYFPDIIGLQECSSIGHSKVINAISDYYGSTCRSIAATTKTCYTPILYRKDRYTLVESGSMLYDQRWPLTDTKTLSWAVLSVKETGKKFIVLNTHAAIIIGSYDTEAQFGYKATDSVDGAKWREDNSRQILEKYEELKAKYGNIPAFIMGDMNDGPSAKSITMLTKDTGFVTSTAAATISRTTGATYHSGVGTAPSLNGSPIDHIFVTRNLVNVFTHTINRNQEAYDSSDHCQVYIDISMK